MTSFEEAFAASVTGPDERAAGVISGSDPYRELELYLEKVHDEIGEVFDKWSYLSEASRTSTKSSYRQEKDGRTHCAIRPDKFLVNNHDTSFVKSCSLPSRRNSSRCETYLDAWSKSLLAEFGTVLQSGKSADAIENAEDDYDEVAADSSDDDSMRMKYHISQRDDFEISSSSSPTVSPSTSEHSSSGSSGTRRTPPYLSRIGRGKQRSHVASVHNKRDPMLVNVKIYPTERSRVPETRKADYEFENSQRSYIPVKCYTGQNYSKSRLAVTDTGTQTSPAESRSSSFTWMSDCSEDDHSSTTSSTEDSRRLGDSSGDLTPVKDEPESGIGTASFPRHNKYNKSSNVQKSDRKELWEKLRRRPKEKLGSTSRKSPASHSDVDRQKNCIPVESSSDPDLAVFRIPRPSRLPLASSSLSPESSRETLPSPSATSLTLGLEPCDLMVREFAGKSSSAPLLLKQPLYSSTQKVSKYSKFHSEKLLIGCNSTVCTSTGASLTQMHDHSVVGLKSVLSLYFSKYVSRVLSSDSGIAKYDSEGEHQTGAILEKSILNDLTNEPSAKILRSVVVPKRRYFFRNDGKTIFQPVTSETYFVDDENVASNGVTGFEVPYWDNQIESSMSDPNPFWGDSNNAENEMILGRGSLSTTDVTKVPIDTLSSKMIESPSILHNIIIPEPKIFFKSKLTRFVSVRPVNDKSDSTISADYSDKIPSVAPVPTTIIEGTTSESDSSFLQSYGNIPTNAITEADSLTHSTRSENLESETQSAESEDIALSTHLILSTYLRPTPKPREDVFTRLQPSKNFKSSESIPSTKTKNVKAMEIANGATFGIMQASGLPSQRTTKILKKDPSVQIVKQQHIGSSTQPVHEKSMQVSWDELQTKLRSDLTTRSRQSMIEEMLFKRIEEDQSTTMRYTPSVGPQFQRAEDRSTTMRMTTSVSPQSLLISSRNLSTKSLMNETPEITFSRDFSHGSKRSETEEQQANEKKYNFNSSQIQDPEIGLEIEAAEACKWLRAAGFPQYAQMYEDKQFPIDLNSVQNDHQFLEPDALQSLFRRFQTLNKCANMKVELMPTKLNQDDESDSDTECALSEYWSFQRESRRWSRNRHASEVTPPTSAVEESCENVAVVMRNDSSTLPSFAVSQSEPEIPLSRFRRSGSERLRDGAKAFLRRVESLKSRRRKHKNRDGVVISEPQIVDIISMEARIKELNCVDVTPPESPVTSQNANDSANRYLSKPETDFSAFSDSEVTVRQTYLECVNNCSKANALKMSDVSDLAGKRKQFPSRSDSQDSQAFCTAKATVQKKNEIVDSRVGAENDTPMRPKTTAISRWHSFQRHSVQPNSAHGQSINSLAVGQIVVLRKLAMLKLTAVMERHCLSHRTTGWNWELPKFIRKAKTPDYKDKSVFGLPLLANVQQTGYVLPAYIREALEWLRLNALDQVGIFRKPGVRSRINRLKFMANIKNAKISFDNQQPFDVADMVKQYFRELPDALLTNKLSDTFVSIFQYVPENLRKEALQCALILLPDEHRDALYILLAFLNLVAQHSYVNQMTASNLAMCLAPSLFHWTHSSSGHQIRRSSSVSPKRLQKSGTFPDVKELGQNKAAHECIHHLILNHQNLFMVSEDVMRQCHFSFMDESIPVSLDELGEELQQDWRGYLNMCRTALQKEIKDKNRGWITSTVWEDVEIAYKKVRDGHPLRLWRVYTEVEAPPKELLYRILRERHVWDPAFVQSKVVRRVDPDAELFQYVTSDVGPLPQKDFCVIRSWQTDLSKGGCMVVETSVEHPEAKTELNSVRGIVLASRYLIEPCGSGKSRILHLSRVDIKGKSSDWYNKCYGHICAQYLSRIRNSFQRMTEGPESKV